MGIVIFSTFIVLLGFNVFLLTLKTYSYIRTKVNKSIIIILKTQIIFLRNTKKYTSKIKLSSVTF